MIFFLSETKFLPHVLAGLLVLFVSACSTAPEPVHREQVLAFGTLVDITLWGVDEETAQQASAAVIQTLNQLHRTWHAWEPSALTRINQRLAAGLSADVEPAMLEVIRRAQQQSRASQDLFNPAIGRLVELWGFHNEERLVTAPPDPKRINALLHPPARMTDLHITERQVRSSNPHVQLDFGAYIKGYGVDLAIEKLRSYGINNAIVNAGGDLRAIGRHGQRPWKIGIRHPRAAGMIASLDIQGDESVFTSGDYERYFDYQGRRYHHIIDPRTGYPATGAIAATVVSANAAQALGASTALMVAGPQDWLPLLAALGIDKAMLIDAQGKVYITARLNQRLHFESNFKPEIVVSPP